MTAIEIPKYGQTVKSSSGSQFKPSQFKSIHRVSKVLLFTTSRDPAHVCLREIVAVIHSLTHLLTPFIHSVTLTHSREQPIPRERPKRRFEVGERHEGAL